MEHFRPDLSPENLSAAIKRLVRVDTTMSDIIAAVKLELSILKQEVADLTETVEEQGVIIACLEEKVNA